MKKEVILVAILCLVLIAPLAFAIEVDEGKIDEAYNCTKQKVDDITCSELSLEEMFFSALAIKECKSEILNSFHETYGCWPSTSCDAKLTAQGILALQRFNYDTETIEDWLITQNTTTSDIDWYLQIESSEATTCTIEYGGSSRTVNLGADKKFDSDVGNCLTLAQDGYWLQINPSCYPEEFEISCTEDFISSLLFKTKGSSTVNVLDSTSSAVGGGTTFEQVNSFCFKRGSSCNYETTLWSTRVLDSLGYDVSPYMPYLIVFAEDNERYLADSFLYYITNDEDYRTNLILSQKKDSYWEESGDSYYDTALVLWHLQNDDSELQDSSIEWLMQVQGKDGCWNSGNLRDTEFILYALWERDSFNWPTTGGTGDDADCFSDLDCNEDYICEDGFCISNSIRVDCQDKGYSCLSSYTCTDLGGNELEDYSCSGMYICCDQKPAEETCDEMNGVVCDAEQRCSGGIKDDSAYDLSSDEVCCIGGTCTSSGGSDTGENECEDAGGTCRSYGCSSGESEDFSLGCEYSSDSCCMSSGTSSGKSWWIWLLLIGIILVVVAIIYKDKLKVLFIKLKSKFKKEKKKPERRGPAPMQNRPPMRPIQRRILPPSQKPQPGKPPKRKSPELEEVLKKLREMGK